MDFLLLMLDILKSVLWWLFVVTAGVITLVVISVMTLIGLYDLGLRRRDKNG